MPPEIDFVADTVKNCPSSDCWIYEENEEGERACRLKKGTPNDSKYFFIESFWKHFDNLHLENFFIFNLSFKFKKRHVFNVNQSINMFVKIIIIGLCL